VRDLNRVILIGRATKDFELRYTPNGVAVANGTIAVDRPVAQGKEKETDFINLQAWKQLAETAANYIRKGHKFAVEGRIQVRNYDNNEGRRVYVTEVVAERLDFLEPKSDNHTSQTSGQSADRNRNDPFANDRTPQDFPDNDLPF
jgi:single-strand DNA-binding protein